MWTGPVDYNDRGPDIKAEACDARGRFLLGSRSESSLNTTSSRVTWVIGLAAVAALGLALIPAALPTGPSANLDAAGALIVDAILLNAPDATQQTKRRSLKVAQSLLDAEAIDMLVREHAAKRQSPEADEGLASFAEKRKPAWYRS